MSVQHSVLYIFITRLLSRLRPRRVCGSNKETLLGLESGYRVKYGLSPQDFLRAEAIFYFLSYIQSCFQF